jgi:D-aminopeptidase
MSKPRARQLGLDLPGEPGRWNAITDVAGVRVGMTTVIDTARGIRTGVTAIVPREDTGRPQPVWAGQAALNGNGEMTGSHWINDAGYFFGPVCITNTHSVGVVHHAATRWTIDRYSEVFREHKIWAMPVVAETYDGTLNDINGQHVTVGHALAALDGATTGPVDEGGVGGGAGMICYGFKGGTGTSSRRVVLGGEEFTIAALVQANHGILPWLTILGVPIGRRLAEGRPAERESGSIIAILATDAPLGALSLRHLARRAGLGVGRGGSPGGNDSGDLFLAFSVADPTDLPQLLPSRRSVDRLNNEILDPLYLAAIEAVEEAVLNALFAGEDAPTVNPPGGICPAIDTARVLDLLGHAGRLRKA